MRVYLCLLLSGLTCNWLYAFTYAYNLALVFKLQNHLLPVRLHNMLNSDSRMKPLEKRHQYDTRNKSTPKLPVAMTRHYHTSFLFQSLKDFEMVPLEIRNTKTLFTFKTNMKKKLLKP